MKVVLIVALGIFAEWGLISLWGWFIRRGRTPEWWDQ